eukprot:COSAG05_NODE_3221_length_2191_cov_98.018318_1_plen_123_part_10
MGSAQSPLQQTAVYNQPGSVRCPLSQIAQLPFFVKASSSFFVKPSSSCPLHVPSVRPNPVDATSAARRPHDLSVPGAGQRPWTSGRPSVPRTGRAHFLNRSQLASRWAETLEFWAEQKNGKDN